MSIEKLLKKNLPNELYTQVVDALGDDFDFDYVPRSRLNAVIKQRNDLRQQMDIDPADDGSAQTTPPQPNAGEPPSAKELKDLAKLQAKVDELEKSKQAEIDAVKTQYALTDALRSEGCRKPELLIKQLDMSLIKFNEKGSLEGHADQIKAWKESDPYLFNEAGEGTGAAGVGTGGTVKKASALDAELESIFGVKLD